MSMTWEEACRYIWRGRLTGTLYKFKIENEYVYWSKEHNDVWALWITVKADALACLRGYVKIKDNPDHVFISQEEKICRKIALMEARWLKYQWRKHHV